MAADLAEFRMNVAALKRVDPYIKDILGTATQVALYTFSPVKNEWEKTDVEGALFVCSRNGEPFNNILIMNRRNTNNLVEPIIKDLDWQMQAPFLLYRNTRNNIYGIWFYNRDECVKITYLLETIMESVNKQHQEKSKKKVTSNTDIFSMLTRAQENFNKAPAKTDSQPQTSTDVTSQSVMEFFAKASTTKTTHQTPVRVPTGEKEPLQPLLHRLMSNPAHTVEHIEKQQRTITPQEPASKKASKQEIVNRNSASFSISPAVQLENGHNFMRITSPTSSGFFTQTASEDQETRPISPPLAPMLETPQKPNLMPPMMFTSTAVKESALQNAAKPEISPDSPEPLTRKQMIQAFHYLLKNDPEFVTKLHEAYVKSFTEMVS